MREIQNDLQERATVIDEQIRAACAHYEKAVQQLQTDRDAKIRELKSDLAMIAKFMEFEQRYTSGHASEPQPQVASLADLFLGKLKENGAVSKDELIGLTIKEGFFRNTEEALRGVHPMVVSMLRSEQIRELPNGNFALPLVSHAPPAFSQVVRLKA
jgi:hypothetical protein